MIFETKRLFVTKWQTGELKPLYELFNDEAIKEFILPELTIEETTHILEKQLNDYAVHFPFGRYFIVEKSSGEFIGLLLFKETKNSAGVEIGYSLKKKYWNNGYATETVKQSMHWLFTHKRFTSIYAVTETNNTNSQHVLLKCGFAQEENFIQDGKEMSLFEYLVPDS